MQLNQKSINKFYFKIALTTEKYCLIRYENEELKKANKNNPEASAKTIESLALIFQPKKQDITDLKNDVKPTEQNQIKKDEETDDEDEENTTNEAKGSALADLITKTCKKDIKFKENF